MKRKKKNSLRQRALFWRNLDGRDLLFTRSHAREHARNHAPDGRESSSYACAMLCLCRRREWNSFGMMMLVHRMLEGC